MATNKKLYRSKEDKMIFGVCGGLGEYFNIDPVIIRIIFVILAIFGAGSGVLAYIILAIVIPEKPDKNTKKTERKTEEVIEENVEKLAKEVENIAKKSSNSSEMFFGLLLLLLGMTLLASNFFPIFEFRKFWPLILIFIALFILFRGNKEQK